MKIYVLEPLGPNDKLLLKNLKADVTILDTRGLEDDALIEKINDADILALTNRPLSKHVLSSCKNLKLIAVAFSGLDHVDLDAAKSLGITVKNASGYAMHAVSELAICLCIALYRQLLDADRLVRDLKDNSSLLGHEIYNKTVGIIGGGAIGKRTAKLFSSFGATVLIYNRSPLAMSAQYTQLEDLDDLMAKSDIVSLHLPYVKETHHLIDEKKISLMKKTAVFINTARGPIVDTKALSNALNNEKIRGAAIDVFDSEPPLEQDNLLLKAKNTLLSPHIAFKTSEATSLKAQMAIDHIEELLKLS